MRFVNDSEDLACCSYPTWLKSGDGAHGYCCDKLSSAMHARYLTNDGDIMNCDRPPVPRSAGV